MISPAEFERAGFLSAIRDEALDSLRRALRPGSSPNWVLDVYNTYRALAHDLRRLVR